MGAAAVRRPNLLSRAVSVTVIIRRGAAAITFMVRPLSLASVLGGLVMADYAPRARAQQPVVAGKMSGNTADNRSFQAALGRRRSGTQGKSCHRDSKSRGEQYRFHVKLLRTGM